MNEYFIKICGISLISLLTACGGGSSTEPPTPTVNQMPIAKITLGNNQHIHIGEAVTFSADDSTDSNKDKLTYQWSLFTSDNKKLVLDNATAKDITVTFNVEGGHRLALVVNDGKINSEVDEYNFDVVKESVVAKAGPDQSVKIGTLIKLTAKSSYVLQGNITYQWSFTEKPPGSAVILKNTHSVDSEFTADISGSYHLNLIVSNDTGQQSSDDVEIEVKAHAENSSPNARITLVNPQVLVSQTLKLSARDSNDVDGDVLDYLWKITREPSNSNYDLNNYRSVDAEFVAGTIGDYEVELIVSDPDLAWASETSTIKVVAGNQAPIANAGPDQLISTGQTAQLSAIASYDPEQEALRYQWSLIKQPHNSSAQLPTVDKETVNITLDVDGDYIFSLIVSDGALDSKPSQVRVTATTNQKPVAKIKPVAASYLNQAVVLDASESQDAEGADLHYQWQWLSREGDTELRDATSKNPSFTPPISGKYVVQLIVNDGIQDSDPVELSITIQQNLPPVVNIAGGSERGIAIGSEVILDASLTSDPEGGQLTYAWTLQRPVLSNAVFTSTGAATTAFTPHVAGTYTAYLHVTDDAGNIQNKKVVIVVFLDDVNWLGTVSGRLIDSLGRGVANAQMLSKPKNATGSVFYTDMNGYYQVKVGLQEDKVFDITMVDPTLGFGDIVIEKEVSSNNFNIDLGTKTSFVKQNVNIGLTACDGYSARTSIKLEFDAPNLSLFVGDLEQTVSKRQEISIGETSQFKLSSTFIYHVSVENVTSEYIVIKDIATGAYQARTEWELVLQPNASDVVTHNFEVCDRLNP